MVHKWDHYLDIYDSRFHPFRNKSINFLEIGIMHGGSLKMWQNYFGENLRLFGIDINPECKKFEENNIQIHIGSQEDTIFLDLVAQKMPQMDIILDDGGHTMKQQLLTFQHLFPLLKDGGLYIVEDTHTSYWELYGGGLNRNGSFIEFAKRLIDSMHIHHLNENQKVLKSSNTQNIRSISFYDSMIFFEKGSPIKPFHTRLGKEQVSPIEIKESKWLGTWRKWLGKSVRSFSQNDRSAN